MDNRATETHPLLAGHDSRSGYESIANNETDANGDGRGTLNTQACENNQKAKKPPPIPYMQICIISLCRSSQPLFFGVIYPYIVQMLVYDLQVADEVHVGLYSGFVETSASIGMIMGVLVWAKLSDRLGRRPVLLLGMTASCALSMVFGFARTFSGLCALRLLLGVFSAAQSMLVAPTSFGRATLADIDFSKTDRTTKVMVSESSDSETVSTCYALIGVGWQSGTSIAPMLGGILSNPAKTWPSPFGNTLFDSYPYSLPSLAAAVVPLLATIAAFFVLKETHPRLEQARKQSDHSSGPYSGASSSSEGSNPGARGIKQVAGMRYSISSIASNLYHTQNGIPGFATSGIFFIVLLWFLLIAQIIAVEVVQILLFFFSASLGGLSLSQGSMATFLALRPLLICLYEVTVFPFLSRRYGNEALFRTLICIPPFTCGLYLFIATAAIRGVSITPVFLIATLGSSLIIQTITNPVYLAADVLISSRAAHSSQLSTVNAFAEIVAQVGVGIGAWGGSSLFAYSAKLKDGSWGKGTAVWWALIVLTGATAVISQKLASREGWREREQAGAVITED